MSDTDTDMTETLITLTSDIVAAHVSNNSVGVDDVPGLISNVYGALPGLGSASKEEERPEPAVSVRSSIKPDYIVCLEDGKKLKMLKRHLMTHYNMTPDEYRKRWELPADYPMVAPNYAEKRRELAKKIGLGRKPGESPAKKKTSARGTATKKAAASKTSPSKAKTAQSDSPSVAASDKSAPVMKASGTGRPRGRPKGSTNKKKPAAS